MKDARDKASWELASVVAAASFNANPFLKEHATPADFNAFEQSRREPPTLDTVIGQMHRDGFFNRK